MNNPEPNTCRSEALTSQKHQTTNAMPRENPSRREPHSPEEVRDEENTPTKLKKMTLKPQSHLPSLHLNPVYENGIMQRPCEINIKNGTDGSPECMDSDISAYEDAAAETPDWVCKLPHDAGSDRHIDSVNDEKTNNPNADSQDPNPSCVVS